MAAAIILTSCSNNNDASTIPGDPTDTKSVYLQIDFSSGIKAKSDELSGEGTNAPVRSALIYFLDGSADPVIFDVKTVHVNGGDVILSQMVGGYRFDGIPSSVTQVYIVGNYNSSDTQGDFPDFPMTDGLLLSDIQDVVLNIEQVSHGSLADGTTIEGLFTVMDGRSNINTYNNTSSNTWNGSATLSEGDLYANVVISPLIARIEIEEIEYTGNLLSNMTIEGIYINYFFPNAPVNLDLENSSYINNGSNPDAYSTESTDFAYTYYMTMYDLVDAALITSDETTITPDNGVWAYHVFGESDPVPHIILKVTGITAKTGQFIGTRYVTVRGYLDGSNVEITEFDRNTIYKIASLQFNDDDLEIYPETQSQSVWVNVEVADWITVNVTPVI